MRAIHLTLIWAALLTAGPASAQTPIDVFLIGGQSNAMGNGVAAQSPVPASGHAFQFYGGTISALADPVGNATFGSAWPSFAISYYALTGRKVLFVPAARSGAPQTKRVSDVTGFAHWDDAGELVPDAMTALNGAMAAATAQGYAPVFRGVQWAQGESDAIAVVENSGLQYDAGEYASAFYRMIYRFEVAYGPVPFFVYRTGCPNGKSAAYQTAFEAVRNAQEQIATDHSKVKIVYRGASSFCERDLMGDPYHYKQAGYNEMGTLGAGSTVASGLSGPSQ